MSVSSTIPAAIARTNPKWNINSSQNSRSSRNNRYNKVDSRMDRSRHLQWQKRRRIFSITSHTVRFRCHLIKSKIEISQILGHILLWRSNRGRSNPPKSLPAGGSKWRSTRTVVQSKIIKWYRPLQRYRTIQSMWLMIIWGGIVGDTLPNPIQVLRTPSQTYNLYNCRIMVVMISKTPFNKVWAKECSDNYSNELFLNRYQVRVK